MKSGRMTVIRDALRPIMIDSKILKNSKLTLEARGLLCSLIAENCEFSEKSIQEKYGISLNKVGKLLDEIKASDLVEFL